MVLVTSPTVPALGKRAALPQNLRGAYFGVCPTAGLCLSRRTQSWVARNFPGRIRHPAMGLVFPVSKQLNFD